MKNFVRIVLTICLVFCLLGCSMETTLENEPNVTLPTVSDEVASEESSVGDNNTTQNAASSASAEVKEEEPEEAVHEGSPPNYFWGFDSILEAEELLKIEDEDAFYEAFFEAEADFESINNQEQLEEFLNMIYELPFPYSEKYEMEMLSFSTMMDQMTILYVSDSNSMFFDYNYAAEKQTEDMQNALKAKKLATKSAYVSDIFHHDDVKDDTRYYSIVVDGNVFYYSGSFKDNNEAISCLEDFEFKPLKEVLDSKREA